MGLIEVMTVTKECVNPDGTYNAQCMINRGFQEQSPGNWVKNTGFFPSAAQTFFKQEVVSNIPAPAQLKGAVLDKSNGTSPRVAIAAASTYSASEALIPMDDAKHLGIVVIGLAALFLLFRK